jgi:hypothetical protein
MMFSDEHSGYVMLDRSNEQLLQYATYFRIFQYKKSMCPEIKIHQNVTLKLGAEIAQLV